MEGGGILQQYPFEKKKRRRTLTVLRSVLGVRPAFFDAADISSRAQELRAPTQPPAPTTLSVPLVNPDHLQSPTATHPLLNFPALFREKKRSDLFPALACVPRSHTEPKNHAR